MHAFFLSLFERPRARMRLSRTPADWPSLSPSASFPFFFEVQLIDCFSTYIQPLDNSTSSDSLSFCVQAGARSLPSSSSSDAQLQISALLSCVYCCGLQRGLQGKVEGKRSNRKGAKANG
jgi:hypothetical protein